MQVYKLDGFHSINIQLKTHLTVVPWEDDMGTDFVVIVESSTY